MNDWLKIDKIKCKEGIETDIYDDLITDNLIEKKLPTRIKI